jgi:hypothetical protein
MRANPSVDATVPSRARTARAQEALGVLMVVVMMVMVVLRDSAKSGADEHHQEKGCCNKLLHCKNLA